YRRQRGLHPQITGGLTFLQGYGAWGAEHNILIPLLSAGMICSGIVTQPEKNSSRDVQTMRRPVVGIIGNSHRIENKFAIQAVGERNLRAVSEVSGAAPLRFASIPGLTDVGAL